MADERVPIEELIDFPTRYTFKAIGHNKLAFAPLVLEAVRSVVGDAREIELRTRVSSKAAYVSVTVVAQVENADELRGVYAALRTVKELITVL